MLVTSLIECKPREPSAPQELGPWRGIKVYADLSVSSGESIGSVRWCRKTGTGVDRGAVSRATKLRALATTRVASDGIVLSHDASRKNISKRAGCVRTSSGIFRFVSDSHCVASSCSRECANAASDMPLPSSKASTVLSRSLSCMARVDARKPASCVGKIDARVSIFFFRPKN